MKKHSFEKIERIRLKKDIERLYQKGNSIFVYPLKVRYVTVEAEEDSPIAAQVLITVSKKNFKKAVHRNRIKRLIREGYRLNKHLLSPLQGEIIHIHFHYISKKLLDFTTIENGIKELLKQINNMTDKLH
ncbi:MAG: ribonuclease P protein component [Bacteroidia bacterium]|nr:ribonuclease P protein component [Bacteroidia bacterium]MDW8346279.1 ribonuclease P protein component [Bacteroidia bacterium]